MLYSSNLTANCGPPPPPQNGHILQYNSTLEGTEVIYVCWNVHQEENSSQCVEIYTTAICNAKGIWEPKSDDMCSIFSGIQTILLVIDESDYGINFHP